MSKTMPNTIQNTVMNTIDANMIIDLLQLVKHPKEGGFFSETYRSSQSFQSDERGIRSVSTAIYYLLASNTFSEMHRLESDEVFHFYLGDPVEMLNLYPDGTGKRIILGSDIMKGMAVQHVVPAGTWMGGRLLPWGTFALMGTTVAPGFNYSDYHRGEREELIRLFPAFKELITLLTHGSDNP